MGTTKQPDALDPREGEGGNAARLFALRVGAHHPECANAGAIAEGDLPPIWLQPPAGSLVLHRAVIMLKPGVALFARLLFSIVFVEAGNSEPSTVSTDLAGLGVKTSGKGIVLRKLGAVDLQVIVTYAAPIHPAPHALVADELNDADSLVNGALLGLVDSQFVFQYKHGRLASWPLHESRFPASLCGKC
jgi:hypothetical protein